MAECKVQGTLTPEETQSLNDDIGGQARIRRFCSGLSVLQSDRQKASPPDSNANAVPDLPAAPYEILDSLDRLRLGETGAMLKSISICFSGVLSADETLRYQKTGFDVEIYAEEVRVLHRQERQPL